jgi:hypothetical protein
MHRSFVSYANAIMAGGQLRHGDCNVVQPLSREPLVPIHLYSPIKLPTGTCSAIHKNTSVHSCWRRFEKQLHHVNEMNGSTVPANAELLAMEQMPKLWLKITRPRRSSRIKEQSKLQKLFVSALTLAEPLASHNAGSATF